MMNGGTNPHSTVNIRTMDQSLLDLEGPLGPSDATFVPSKKAAADVVAKQQKFEADKVADVASRNAKNSKDSADLRAKVTAARVNQQAGGVSHNVYPTAWQKSSLVYIPEEDLYISLDAPWSPPQSYEAKAKNLAEGLAAVAKQQAFEKKHVADHAKAMNTYYNEAADIFEQNAWEIKNTYQFD